MDKRTVQSLENGYQSESELDSSSSEEEGDKIRVGKDYQATIPDLIPVEERNNDAYPEKALLVWAPTYDISDSKMDEFINLAKDKYGYNGEQALGMLFWHKHDMEQALNDLANFTPYSEDWSTEDKILFDQAFQFHGKNFHRIKQMIPAKTISSLVKYYYSWKKIKNKTSVMDRQVKRLALLRNNHNMEGDFETYEQQCSEVGSNTESDTEDKKWIIHRGIRRENSPPRQPPPSNENSKEPKDNTSPVPKNSCINCGVQCNDLHQTTKGTMCRTCALYFKRTGNFRPTVGPVKNRADRHFSLPRNKRTPPKGMYINHDDLLTVAAAAPNASEVLVKPLNRDILGLKRTIQNNRQIISIQKNKALKNIDEYRQLLPAYRINQRWTNDELLLGVQGIRNFGRDFQAVAEVVGTKNESHVKTFYMAYRKRYNLDVLLQDYDDRKNSMEDGNESTDSIIVEKDGMSSDSEGATSPTSLINDTINSNPNTAQAVVAAK